jgi:probable rRNA maturation factor
VKLPLRTFKRVLHSFLLDRRVLCAEVEIHLVSKRAISALHKELFSDPTPTDCISIEIDPPTDGSPYSHLGEVFVCPKIALESGREPVVEEILLYIVHGLLHLLGLDDQTADQRNQMRKEEKKALKLIKNLQ